MSLTGSMVAIVTPMTADGGLDFAAWNRLLDFHVQEGTDGVVIAGTTGESPALSLEEIEDLTSRALDRIRGRLKIIVGAGTHSTAATLLRVRRLSRLGVDGLMIVTPYYNKPPQEGLYRHFAAAAEAAEAPVILYNVPSRTGVDLLPPTVARLARLPRIVALKEATPQLSRIRELIALVPSGFSVFSGDDATATEFASSGLQGVISVTANVAPRRVREAFMAAMSGDAAAARAADLALQPLHRELFSESNPIPVKWALARMGLIGNGIRLPLVELAAAHQDGVMRAMHAAGITLEDQAA